VHLQDDVGTLGEFLGSFWRIGEAKIARRVRTELATLLAQRGLPGIRALKTTTLD